MDNIDYSAPLILDDMVGLAGEDSSLASFNEFIDFEVLWDFPALGKSI